MKKVLVSLLCAVFLFAIVPVSVSAEENSLEYMTDIVELNLNEEGLVRAFTYYSEVDEATYLVKIYEDRVDLFNLITNDFIHSATITSEIISPMIIQNPIQIDNQAELLSTPDNYESWGSYVFLRNDNLHIGSVEGKTISIIAGLVSGYYNFTSKAVSLATTIYNNRYVGLDAKVYFKTNNYCTILWKERYDYYAEGTSTFIDDEEITSWVGDPWDYSEPAACRILAQRY